ncbi:MAG: siphovirus ReqiPepy6 Gp37-like family protein [Oscillospiraceae bacterium]
MTLYVYNPNMERTGLIEGTTSLQWLSEYQDAGEAKLVCSATEKNIALIKKGNRLYCTEQPESAIITEVESEGTATNAKITARAMFSAGRWADRVVMGTENINNIEAGMLSLVGKHRRGLPGETAPPKGLSAEKATQTTWGSVLDAEKALAKRAVYGFKECFNPRTGIETFEVYEGKNRTSGEHYNGYFGDDIGNISGFKIIDGIADWKNTAIVGGQGEGTARQVVIVTLGEYSGDDLKELWVDAKDISQTYQIATPDGAGGFTYTQNTYTNSEYAAILAARGCEKLAEKIKTLEVDATLEQGLMRYGIDYFIGDTVPIKLTLFGVQFSARVAAIRTIYESTGKKVTAVLSDFNFES